MAAAINRMPLEDALLANSWKGRTIVSTGRLRFTPMYQSMPRRNPTRTTLGLFTELPRRYLLGNPYSYARIGGPMRDQQPFASCGQVLVRRSSYRLIRGLDRYSASQSISHTRRATTTAITTMPNTSSTFLLYLRLGRLAPMAWSPFLGKDGCSVMRPSTQQPPSLPFPHTTLESATSPTKRQPRASRDHEKGPETLGGGTPAPEIGGAISMVTRSG